MEPERRKQIQWIIGAVLIVALLRAGQVLYQRTQADEPSKPVATRVLKSDDFVFLRSLHAYDVASAKKLEGMTVWVKGGNAVAYFKPGERKQEAGLLSPIAELKVSKVVQQGDQVMANFTFTAGGPPGKFSAPIGAVNPRSGDTNLIIDELFYYDDPHKLYAHWPAEVWTKVERHEITQGMNEIQAGMAMGIGRIVGSGGDYGNRTLQYTHGGKTVEVMFRENQAARVEEKTASAKE